MIEVTHCSVCDSTAVQPLYRPRRSPGPVVRCCNCGFVYISPIEDTHALIAEGPVLRGKHAAMLNSTDLNDLKDSWEAQHLAAKEFELPAIKLNAHDALTRIGYYIQAPGRLLDFGCGWGFFLAEVRAYGWEPYGLDPLPACAIYARVKAGATVVSDVLRPGIFPEASFAVITSFQVFEHLPNPNETLAQLVRLLRPGGVILIEVPNIRHWTVRVMGKKHRHYVQDHLNFFSRQTLGKLMERHGLQVVGNYTPTRRMTLRHLLVHWGKYLYSPRVAELMARLPQQVLNVVVPVKLGDIVAVIARRLETD